MRIFVFLAVFLCAGVTPSHAQDPAGVVLTQHNNSARTGAYTHETTLTTTNVNVNQFGLLFKLPLDGEVYSQPLYVPRVAITGQGIHNVLYVATMHNSVYAFDADNAAQTAPLWHINLGPTVPLGVYTKPYGPQNVAVEIGVLSTPVIDLSTSTLYVVALTVQNETTLNFQLHALSLTGGTEEFNGPVTIKASVPGTGEHSVGGALPFRAADEWQRTSLLLSHGIISLGFGSHGDNGDWHGWVIGYNAATLAQAYAFCATPDGQDGGIWQSGNGLAADASGNVYFFTGNGDFTANVGGPDYGDTLVKLNPSSTPLVVDFFTPYNQAALDSADLDLGSGAPIVLAKDGFVVGGGKNGEMYVTNENGLGGFNPTGNTQIVQSWQASDDATGAARISSGPVFWQSPVGGLLYVWPSQDYLKTFRLVSGQFDTTPYSETTFTAPVGCSPFCINSAALSVSANSNQSGAGILWANLPSSGSFNVYLVPGILRAFDATDLTKEIWNSNLNAARDALGTDAKYVPPTIVNGKVYMATFSGFVNVYGLLPAN